jgi:hypothetical protein
MMDDIELGLARQKIKKIIDGNIMIRSAVIALGLYDKAIFYLPELLLIIANNPRGLEIMNELGLEQVNDFALQRTQQDGHGRNQ